MMGNFVLALGLFGLLAFGAIGYVVYAAFFMGPPGILGEAASTTSWDGRYRCSGGDMWLEVELSVDEGPPEAIRRVEATFAYLDSRDAPVGPGSPTSGAEGTLEGNRLQLIGQDPSGAPPFQIGGFAATIDIYAEAMDAEVMSPGCDSALLRANE